MKKVQIRDQLSLQIFYSLGEGAIDIFDGPVLGQIRYLAEDWVWDQIGSGEWEPVRNQVCVQIERQAFKGINK